MGTKPNYQDVQYQTPNVQWAADLPEFNNPIRNRADILFADNQRNTNANYDRNLLSQVNSSAVNQANSVFNLGLQEESAIFNKDLNKVSTCHTILGFGCGASGFSNAVNGAVSGLVNGGPLGAIAGFVAGGSQPVTDSPVPGNTGTYTGQATAGGPITLNAIEQWLSNLFKPHSNNSNVLSTPPFIA